MKWLLFSSPRKGYRGALFFLKGNGRGQSSLRVIGSVFLGVMFLSVVPFVYAEVSPHKTGARELFYSPVITPNGSTMPWTRAEDGAKVFHINVEPCKHEVAAGMSINAWCYNGQTPGPTIEVVEGDQLRIFVTNKLGEQTAVHWHGVLLPNGMDGVSGLTQKGIQPGETFKYEFTVKQHGTYMYHSHGDEMVQMGLGTMGFLVVHSPSEKKVDRDFALFMNEWFVAPGTSTPDPNIMTDFNIFTFNSRAFPGTAPLVVKTGDRVRVRFGNVGQESHPIHLHGFNFRVVATDGGDIPESAQWPETTVVVFPGQTRTIEFVADAPGDWAMHCHRRHHPMNAMGHDIPHMIGVNQDGVEDKVREIVPGYMAMGEHGMDEMVDMGMKGPENTLPMMAGEGQFGSVGMGGMFTVLMVRDNLKDYGHPVQHPHPRGTVAESVEMKDVQENKQKN
jgi:FtsP/CotA-like multicopper oxidase with cupredoxin domain